MRKFVLDVLKTWAELLLYLPLIMLYFIYFSDQSLAAILGELALFYAAGVAAGSLEFISRRIYELAFGAVFGFAVSLAVLGLNEQGIFLALVGLALGYRGQRVSKRLWQEVFPTQAFYTGLISYMIVPVFFLHNHEWKSYEGWYNLMGITALGVYFFYENHYQLMSAAHVKSSGGVQASVRRFNRWLIAGLLAAIVFISHFRQIEHWIQHRLWLLFDWLISRVPKKEGLPKRMVQQNQPEQSDPVLSKKEHRFDMSWLNTVFTYVAVVVLSIIGLILLYLFIFKVIPFLVQQIKRLMRMLAERRGKLEGDEEGYIDEKEKLNTVAGSITDGLKQMLRRIGKREPSWKEMGNNRERARFLYRSMLKKAVQQGYEFNASLTPTETSGELKGKDYAKNAPLASLNAVYNQARYAESEPDEEQLQQLRKQLK